MLAIRTAGPSSLRCRASSQLITHHLDELPLGESSRRHRHATHRHFTSSSPFAKPPIVRNSKAKHLIKATSFARALRNADLLGTRENPAEPSPLLNELEVTHDRTVEEQIVEILSDRPPLPAEIDEEDPYAMRTNLARDKKYRTRYKMAFHRMEAAFVVSQLKVIAGSLGLSRGGTKAILVQNVMKEKGWPAPEPRKKPGQETRPKPAAAVRELNLPENELFLFLRDTRFVHRNMMEHGITFSVVNQSVPGADGGEQAGKTVLQAEGEEPQLERLVERLRDRSRYMTTLTITPEDLGGTTPSAGLLHFVSTVTDAHIQPQNGSYLVSSMSPDKAQKSLQLLKTAGLRNFTVPSHTPLSIVVPPRDHEDRWAPADLCAITPFFSTPSSVIPWHTLSSSYAEIAYRFCKVKRWAPEHRLQESQHQAQPIEDSQVVAVGVDRQPVTLSAYIDKLNAGMDKQAQTKYHLTFGHLLLRHERSSNQGPLSPPIPGQWLLAESASRLSDTSRPIFSPALTPAMAQHTLGTTRKHSRRLTYRSLDGRAIVTFAHDYSVINDEATERTETQEETDSWLKSLQDMVAEMEEQEKAGQRALLYEGLADEQTVEKVQEVQKVESEGGVVSDVQDETSLEESAAAVADSSEGPAPLVEEVEAQTEEADVKEYLATVSAERSMVSQADLMMPDRPIDARLAVLSTMPLAKSAIPEPVKTFFSVLLEPTPATGKAPTPVAPENITIDEVEFQLENDEDMRVVESKTEADDVVLRSVRTKDMILGVDRLNSHSELEYIGDKLPDRFWRELATTTREVDASTEGRKSQPIGKFVL